MTPRVLITGGTGFLGRPCVRHAVAAGMEVHVAARSPTDDVPNGAAFHRADLLDRDTPAALLAAVRPTHLLHLAWVTTPGEYWSAPANEAWAAATRDLLRGFADRGGRRAVVAGTCAEYDWTGDGVCRESATPTRPVTEYGRWKGQARTWVEAAVCRVAWARLFFLYGPREHPARLVPSVARPLLSGRPADCTAGTRERDFLHVEDAAAALVALLTADLTGPVNIGSGEAVSIRRVAESVASATGRPDLLRVGTKPTPPGEPPRIVADVGRLRNELGWRPRWSLDDGLADTVAWWRGRHAA